MASLEPGQSNEASRAWGLFAWRRLVVAVCLLASVAIGMLLWPGRSVESRLRAIDAAYAIPDEENAANAYTELAWDYTGPSLDASILPQNVRDAMLVQPWRSADYPQAAQWLEDRRSAIDALMDISRKSDWRFSVWEARWQSGKRQDAAPQWCMLLLLAANNDLGEGRTEAGLEKLLSALRMAEQFRAQVSPWDNLAGRTILSWSLQRFDKLVMTEEVPQEWLARFEAALPPAENGWTGNDRQVEIVRRLYEQEYQRGVVTRLTSILTRLRLLRAGRAISGPLELGQCRVARTLLALRRCRNETGAWPENLCEVESRVSPEALIDPLSAKPLGYRHWGDAVVLYSVGLNGIDEGGKLSTGGRAGDDWVYWVGKVKP